MIKHSLCHLLLHTWLLSMLAGCAMMISKDARERNENLKFEVIPNGWSLQHSDDVQFLFRSDRGDILYADSFCDYFDPSEKLENISYRHLSKFEKADIIRSSERKNEFSTGLYSHAVIARDEHKVNLLHYAFISGDCYYEIHTIADKGQLQYLETSLFAFVKGIRL